jgi:glycosyl transferase family 25
MRTFFINLDRNPERLAHMTSTLGAIGLKAERVAAIDGRKISPAENAGANPLLSAGEIGCLLSHQAVWRLIAEGVEPFAAVLEDDIHVSPDLTAFLRTAEWIPGDADVMKLETSRDRVAIDRQPACRHDGRLIQRLASTHPGTAGYVISARAARRLMSRKERMDRPVDALLFELPDGAARGLVVYQVNPALCIQDDFLPGSRNPVLASTIQQERRSLRRNSRSIRDRIKRLAGSLVAPLLDMRRGPSQGQEQQFIYQRIPFSAHV